MENSELRQFKLTGQSGQPGAGEASKTEAGAAADSRQKGQPQQLAPKTEPRSALPPGNQGSLRNQAAKDLLLQSKRKSPRIKVYQPELNQVEPKLGTDDKNPLPEDNSVSIVREEEEMKQIKNMNTNLLSNKSLPGGETVTSNQGPSKAGAGPPCQQEKDIDTEDWSDTSAVKVHYN